MAERLHKVLARHGLGSRREIEKWMLEGRVLLNGKVVLPGEPYRSGDRVQLDGRDVTAHLRTFKGPQVLIYHKAQGQPLGMDERRDGEALQDRAANSDAARLRASVLESLPAIRGGRWLAINAMQSDDSGLLLLTRDGSLSDALRRRAATTPTAYVARVLVPTPDFDAATVPQVIDCNGQRVVFDAIRAAGGEGTNRWYRVEASHAHRRAAVRALFQSQGLKVSRVIQVAFAGIELPRDLPRGSHRALPEQETQALYARAGLSVPQVLTHPSSAPPARRPPPDRRKPRRGGATGTGRSRR